MRAWIIRKMIALVLVTSAVLIIIVKVTNMRRGGITSFMSQRSNYNAREWPHISSFAKLVVFDAAHHLGSLDFLDVPDSGVWTIVVTNARSEEQMDSCEQCSYIPSGLAESYLDVEDFESWPSHEKVKMATYLKLLSMQPTWMYVTNKAQEIPYKVLSRVVDNEITTGPVPIGPSDVFEPCHHFVDPATWRGKGQPGQLPGHYSLMNVSRQSVYFLVDECFHDDVTENRWKTSLDQRAPIPYVMPGTFGVLDFNNVLVSRETLWTLVAAIADFFEPGYTVKLDSLKLNMAVQRILWETQHLVGFLPSPPHQKKCGICTITHHIERLGPGFRQLLANWRCPPSRELISCLADLVNNAIGNQRMTSLVSTWQRSLSPLLPHQIPRQPLTTSTLQNKFSGRPLLFSPAKLLSSNESLNPYPPNVFGKMCMENGKQYEAVVPANHPIQDVVVLIMINHAKHVQNIPLLEYLYGRYFSHIIYCSLSIDIFVELYQSKNQNNSVSFLTMSHAIHTHVCTSGVIKMNYDVIGYFQFSDDVLVNLWNYQNVPMKQPWFQYFIGVGPVRAEHLTPGNGGAKHYSTWFHTRRQMNAAWDHLQTKRHNSTGVERFLQMISNSTKCSTCIYFGNADIFYLPRRIGKDFAAFADFFHSHNVHFEITIINVIGGLVAKQDIYRLSGLYTWGGDRARVDKFYKVKDQFYHPWKFTVLDQPKSIEFFCEQYIHNLDKELIRRAQP